MKRYLTLVVLASSAVCAASFAFAERPLYPMKDCDQYQTQFDLNECANANADAADLALNRLYRKVMAEQPDDASRRKLRDTERAWIAYKERECATETGPRDEGGSIWPLEMANCQREKTDARIRELKAMQ